MVQVSIESLFVDIGIDGVLKAIRAMFAGKSIITHHDEVAHVPAAIVALRSLFMWLEYHGICMLLGVIVLTSQPTNIIFRTVSNIG